MSEWWSKLSFLRKLAVCLFVLMWIGFSTGLLVSYAISWQTLVALAALWLVFVGVTYAVTYDFSQSN